MTSVQCSSQQLHSLAFGYGSSQCTCSFTLGMGLGMLLFVAQFLDFLSTTMVAVVLVALVHGVYITRPSVPPGSEERQQLLTVVGAFAAACLISALGCGFQLGGDLTPFGVFRGA